MSESTEVTVDITAEPLPFMRKLGYSLGGPAVNLSIQVMSNFLLFFYTDVFGITAAAAGIILVIARIIDAVADPTMGFIADHTRTRWGKYRPYLLFGAPLLSIFYVLTFITPEMSPSNKVLYAGATYIIYGVLLSVVGIPYNSMIAAISQNPNERASLTAIGMVLNIILCFPVIMFMNNWAGLFPSPQIGWPAVVSVISFVCLIFFWVAFASNKEKIDVASEETMYSIRQLGKVLLSNKFLLILCAAYLASTITGVIRGATALYFFKYNVGNIDYFKYYILVMALPAILGIAFAPMLVRKFGSKKNVWMFGSIAAMAFDLVILFTGYNYPALFFFCNFMIGLFGGIPMTLNWAMVPDTVEYGEWKSGIRAAGMTISSFSFMSKFGSAVGGGAAGLILSWVGYVPNAVQTPLVLKTILYCLALGPAISGVIGIIIMGFYKIDNAYFTQLVNDINARKGKKEHPDERKEDNC